MQKVSKKYKDSMKSSLRERAYIMISFGLINQEAQAKARVDNGDFNYYSNKTNVFRENSDKTVYATLEENFTKVDGTMFFPPRRSYTGLFYDTGIISDSLVSDGIYELTINLNMVAIDFKGLTINFGENYPVDFDIIGSSGQRLEFRNNNKANWSTEEVLNDTTFIKLIFYRMKNLQSRLRIYSIRFGYGLIYYNDSVLNSSLESYISPIGADVPQIDFSVQLKNYDNYFNVDNPKSAINFLETGQEMEIYYGYQLPKSDEIEWIKGNRLLCSEWESDDYTATIRCQDIFRNMESEYYRGSYIEGGRSYYELAVDVLKDANLEDYYIDPRLKNLYSKNPLPRVKHKEALQIIANACRCVLSQTRNGSVQIKSNFVPKFTISCNGQTSYSNLLSIVDNSEKREYGTFATNYTTTDGAMYLLPRNQNSEISTGYVSEAQSYFDCTFTNNPIITIKQEAAFMYYGVKLIFGNALPAEFIIRTYNNGELVTEYTSNEEEIQKTTAILNHFDDFDTMTIEFTKTAEPFNRIVLNYFSFGDLTDFTMERIDMTSSPKAIKQELIKEVIVPCYSYQQGTQKDSLISEEVDITKGQIETYYIGEASYGFEATLNGDIEGVSILEYGSYYIRLQYKVSGHYRLNIIGYRYKIVERYANISLNVRGKTIKWENPLISDMEMAKELAHWLSDYYSSGIEYEYNTRGNPEIDSNDIVYQENEYHKDMKVNIYRHTLNFKQAFSGKVRARRIGG